MEKTAALALRPVAHAGDLLEAFGSLRAAGRSGSSWLLDSALPDARLGRFCFAGAEPYAVLRAWGTRIELEVLRAARPGLEPGRHRTAGDPLEVARALLPVLPVDAAARLPFVGGAVGWLGYELAELLEPVVFRSDPSALPDLALLYVDRVLACDRESGETFACGLGFGAAAAADAARAAEELAAALRARARTAAGAPRRRRASQAGSPQQASAYAKTVDAIREEIDAGNVYQACLTTRFERALRDPWRFYTRLRARNPAPFASFLELPEACVASSSPERFLRVGCDGSVESRPIKGTRPRDPDPARDAALRASLAGSAKDRAENLMIVDLVRNDLGRVCEIGSVSVPELMAIEAYAAVFQMVSTVRGRLRRGCDAFDALRASFPPGSMTGAPKIAAMRLLERLEPVRRGIYSGAIGYFDARGGADLSVVIRAAIARDGRAFVHAGGGIVADSDPAAEWREALCKAAPLLALLEEEAP